ncbi:MAG: hypothetical protein IH946_09580 [Bacteroidetes bacterium]|nr:hypothetical protein [Bacteroidota bacterium]
MSQISPKLLVLTAIILVLALLRILPHPPNFTPIGAMALFGAAYFTNKKLAFIIPLGAMFISDLILGFHGTMTFVYMSFILIGVIGLKLSGNVKTGRVIGSALIASVLFFLVTNFGVWLMGNFYPKDFGGLMACYAAGLAFYQYSVFGSFFLNTVMGDLFFVSVLFGGYEFVKSRVPMLQTA